jgi:hypothetical protein
MTVKDWAKKLNGIEYPSDELDRFDLDMKKDGIIVVNGASDDLLDFHGVIHDELGAYEGTEVRIASREKGTAFIFDKGENRDTAEFNRKEISAMQEITAIWEPVEDGKMLASWLIETEIPHETFDIMEKGGLFLFCRGVVFHVNDVKVVRQ